MEDCETLRERICRAIEGGDAGSVRCLLDESRAKGSRFDINDPCDPTAYEPRSPLLLALRANDPHMVRLILEQPGIDPTRSLPRYETWRWVRSASRDVMELLFAHARTELNRADGNGKTALHEAAAANREPAAKITYLLERGAAADPKQHDGTTPLYRAALSGHADAVGALLRYPVDVNDRNTDNLWTVLMVAVAQDHPEIVEQLLRRPEVDVNARSDAGDTALHLAAERGYAASVELLLQRRDVNVNEKNRSGWTPLISAAFANRVAIVKLLSARNDVLLNAVDQDRQTALHWAALAGNTEVVGSLLARPEINVRLTNRPARQTAYDLAVALRKDAIARLLRERETTAQGADELSEGDVYQPRSAPPSAGFVNRAPIARALRTGPPSSEQ
jgi:ankyrin repeat protein